MHKKWTGHIFASQGIYLKSLYSFTLHLFQIFTGPYGNAYKVFLCQFSKINIFDERSDVYKKDYLATSLDTQKSFRILRIWFASISIILYEKGSYWCLLRIDNIKLYGNLLLLAVFSIQIILVYVLKFNSLILLTVFIKMPYLESSENFSCISHFVFDPWHRTKCYKHTYWKVCA